MNNTCKVIWSHVLQQMVVVSELASSAGKTQSRRQAGAPHMVSHLNALTAAVALAFAAPAFAQQISANALPTAGAVVAGQASISSNAATMSIQQSTARAIIDWNSFNVGSSASVNFIQPNAQSATLNRVTGPEASTVLGRITAPGQVIITNGNGVFFGRDATIDVGSLAATTHSISNDNFMNGRMVFERQGATGSVVNEGEIKTKLEGYVALLAPEVRNDGVIIANKGAVALAAGETIELQLSTTQQLQGVRVEAGQWKALVDTGGAGYTAGGGGGGGGSYSNATLSSPSGAGGLGSQRNGGAGIAGNSTYSQDGGAGGGATANAAYVSSPDMYANGGGAGYTSSITGQSAQYGQGGGAYYYMGGTNRVGSPAPGSGSTANGYSLSAPGTFRVGNGADGAVIVRHEVGNASQASSAALKLVSGTGTVSVSSAVSGLTSLEVNSSVASSISGSVSGTGSTLTNSGSGALTVTGTASYTGQTTVTSSSITFTNNAAPATSGFAGAGTVTIEPSSASFTSALTSSYSFANTLTGLTLGKSGNAANITIGSATSIAGPVNIYGGNVAINAPLTATSNTITLKGTGTVTDGTSGYLVADKLLLLGGAVTLDHASNNVATLAASGVSGLTYLDSNALTIGTVGSTHGINATGAINVQTQTNDLTIAKNVDTSNTSANAIVLNAGKNESPLTSTGGNVLLSGSPTISAGTGSTIKIYTGQIGAANGPETLVSTGQGRFRYNADETTDFASGTWTNLGTGTYVVYRERPSVSITGGGSYTMTYGETMPTMTTTSTANGDVATVDAVGRVNSASGNIRAGSYSVTSNLVGLGYDVSGLTSGTLNVAARPLEITANDQTKVYGNTDPAFTYSAEVLSSGRGQIVGDSLTGALSRASGSNVGDYAIALGTLANPDYAISLASNGAKLAITQRPITITASSGQTKVYGEADPTFSYTAEANSAGRGLVGGDTFSGALSRAAGTDVGSSYTINQGTLANSNYAISVVGGSFAITQRPITIVASSGQSKVYGEADPTLSYTPEANSAGRGLVGSDAFSGALSRAAGTDVGSSYTISQGTLANSNYAINFAGANFGITQRPITLVIDGKTKAYGDADPSLTYNLSAGNLIGSDTLNLSRATGESAGKYLISATNSNYAITANAANLEITAPPEQFSTTVVSQAVAGKLPASFVMGGLAVNPASRVSTPGVKVELVDKPQLSNAGLVTVTVPSDASNPNVGLSFALPPELVASFASSVGVEAALTNGTPLPKWLAFDSTNGQFVLSSPPQGAFPLEVALQIGGKKVVVNISERGGS